MKLLKCLMRIFESERNRYEKRDNDVELKEEILEDEQIDSDPVQIDDMFVEDYTTEKANKMVTLPNAYKVSDKLLLKLPQDCNMSIIVVGPKAVINQPKVANIMYVGLKDMVYILTYEKKQVYLRVYCMLNLEEKNNSFIIDERELSHINQIDDYDYIPENVKKKIKSYFHLVGSPSQLN